MQRLSMLATRSLRLSARPARHSSNFLSSLQTNISQPSPNPVRAPRRGLSTAAKSETDEYITLTFVDMNDDPPSRHVVRALIPTPSNSVPSPSPAASAPSGPNDAPAVGPKVAPAVPQHLLDLAHANNLDLEGACGGELACSTCHCVFKKDEYDRIIASGQKIKDEEEDMLDLAYGLTKTSRLGCQIKITKALDGIEVSIPKDEFS